MNTMNVKAITNGIIPPADLPCTLNITAGTFAEAKEAIEAGVPHYVRHPATATLLGAEPQAGFYAPQIGDMYLVLRLRAGTAPRGTEVEARVEDLEVLRVEVLRTVE